MESSAKGKKEPVSSKKIIIIAVALIILVIAIAAVVVVYTLNGKDANEPQIGYATEAKVMLDEDSLQAAVDEAQANAKNGMVALQYQNDAFSSDGKTFSCYIANAPTNLYDMFVTIYSDAELTDQVYLSGLVPPGSGFEEITLDHELPTGDNTVYVAITQVETDEETGEQIMRNQVMHTIVFHVG